MTVAETMTACFVLTLLVCVAVVAGGVFLTVHKVDAGAWEQYMLAVLCGAGILLALGAYLNHLAGLIPAGYSATDRSWYLLYLRSPMICFCIALGCGFLLALLGRRRATRQ